MKKIVSYTLGILFIVTVCQITACHKFIDFFKDHDGPSPDTLCRISQMTSYGYATSDTSTLYFKYNAQGNPDSAVPSAALKTVRPTYLFKYDTLGKLQHLGVVIFYDPALGYNPGDGAVVSWSSYSWSGNNIVSSSTFTGGGYINGQPILSGPATIVLYEYDTLDRIVKTRTKPPFVPEYQELYSYNTDGNLSTYAVNDHKTNLFRTNKIWMFLARDYSRNNPLTGATYNLLGLPLNTTQTSGRTFLPGAVTPDHASISYNCQGL